MRTIRCRFWSLVWRCSRGVALHAAHALLENTKEDIKRLDPEPRYDDVYEEAWRHIK